MLPNSFGYEKGMSLLKGKVAVITGLLNLDQNIFNLLEITQFKREQGRRTSCIIKIVWRDFGKLVPPRFCLSACKRHKQREPCSAYSSLQLPGNARLLQKIPDYYGHKFVSEKHHTYMRNSTYFFRQDQVLELAVPLVCCLQSLVQM